MVVLCAVAFGNLAPAFPSDAGAPRSVAQQRVALTFVDRVRYQRAIEEVYWSHRIWPAESSQPKPSLDQVMSREQIEINVKEYLRDVALLQGYWNQAVTPGQLQAEMERMARNTKKPEVLREIFDALGNDPHVIAECVARPLLSGGLVRQLYAYDQRFHGELLRHVQAELANLHSVERMKSTSSGKYSEIEWRRTELDRRSFNGTAARLMDAREWTKQTRKLVNIFCTGKKPH